MVIESKAIIRFKGEKNGKTFVGASAVAKGKQASTASSSKWILFEIFVGEVGGPGERGKVMFM